MPCSMGNLPLNAEACAGAVDDGFTDLSGRNGVVTCAVNLAIFSSNLTDRA